MFRTPAIAVVLFSISVFLLAPAAFAVPADEWLPVDTTDTSLTSPVMGDWVQFARSGNPNRPEHLNWSVYDTKNPLVLDLGDNIAVAKPRDSHLCELLGPGQQNKNRTQNETEN